MRGVGEKGMEGDLPGKLEGKVEAEGRREMQR